VQAVTPLIQNESALCELLNQDNAVKILNLGGEHSQLFLGDFNKASRGKGTSRRLREDWRKVRHYSQPDRKESIGFKNVRPNPPAVFKSRVESLILEGF